MMMMMAEKVLQANDGLIWCYGEKGYKSTIGQAMKRGALTTASLFFIIFFMVGFLVTRYTDVSTFTGTSFQRTFLAWKIPKKPPSRIEFPLMCAHGNSTTTPQTCPSNHLKKTYENYDDSSPTEECPEYFRWIQEDLRPWKEHGISREMVESAQRFAHFRFLIVNGTAYMKKYGNAFQTRDVFTVWGILQLLRLYPGKLPDLDLMFQCNDTPVIRKRDYGGQNRTNIPPLFHYCADDKTADIVFPDWSFWGWAEINIKPWESLGKELEEGNHRTKWMEREPYAFWKGNVGTGRVRQSLFKCNGASKKDWNAQIYALNWGSEVQQGFKNTNLADQCTHRYKIYAEGNTWSVSEKYILACDSMSLLITPQYYDFFTRSLLPMVHYWPIKPNRDMCRSIKFAVDWGNNHTQQAQEIGKAGTKFMQEKLKMKNVYDYMFHLLSAYAELLKYKPTIPEGAVVICSETTVCNIAEGLVKKFKMETMVKGPSNTSPCVMPSPSNRPSLQEFLERKENLTKQVEMLEASGKI